MQKPLQITFKNFPHSDAVEQAVREKARKLEKFSDRITACQAVLEMLHRHHRKGNHFGVRLVVHVPGKELIVTHHNNPAHEDIYVAIRDAFEAAQRQLQDYLDTQREV